MQGLTLTRFWPFPCTRTVFISLVHQGTNKEMSERTLVEKRGEEAERTMVEMVGEEMNEEGTQVGEVNINFSSVEAQ